MVHSDAIEGALARGANGRAYLVGDENLTFRDYFGAFFQAAAARNQADTDFDQAHVALEVRAP